MQTEVLGSNDIEGLTADNLIPDALSIVELGKQLLLSAKHGETETVRDLMCRGAPFTTDWLGTSALHLAAQSNHVDTAEVLLRAGISRDARTKVDRTPLHMAAYEGHHEMAVLLLNYGADVDSRDMLRMTPLHWAVEREHEEVMHVLLDHGADANAISKFDKTPISLALEHDRLDLVDILQQEREVLSLREEKQRQANTAEIEEATHSLMKMQEAERKQEQQQFEMQQQLQQKRKIQQAQPVKKQKVLFQPIHVSPSSDDEREKEAELAARISSIENSTFKKRKELGGLSGLEQPLRLLEAHGITMIPVDNDASIVENAMESGRTVVLTEAGKLALNLTRNSSMSGKKLQDVQIGGTTYKARRKVIAIRADQILNKSQPPLTPKGPNILKRNTADKPGKLFLTPIPNNSNNSSNVTTPKPTITPKVQKKALESPPKEKNPILLKLDDDIEEIEEESSAADSSEEQVMDIVLLNKQLIEARRLAAEYRKQLQKKEEEAEIYKQQLKNITAQTTTK
ncbi:poly [ADP-ribose] polymerase tankyrase-2 isoform X2 [Diachasma alloeum]|uniref:poly [ADP-ribose] polymerase tankyrase-2 isoform X2 n=1 Tax=Diachasma alloeum TaxID=454923 RepID=UPI000738284A|nr:poly [ADP-ribose] polymerase tankyrase-2 isoform X2 [Diachasma alloeum]